MSFNSTRKKRSTQKKSPLAFTVTICGICLQEEDRSDDTTVEWIECTKCGIAFILIAAVRQKSVTNISIQTAPIMYDNRNNDSDHYYNYIYIYIQFLLLL